MHTNLPVDLDQLLHRNHLRRAGSPSGPRARFSRRNRVDRTVWRTPCHGEEY